MRFTYIISNFILIILALSIIWRKDRPSKKVLLLLAILAGIGLINGLAENPALRWGIWWYNEPKTLGIRVFGSLFETYIYCIVVPIVIGSAALKFAERQDAKTARVKKK